ncbi:MAG: hypothetical protein N3A01_01225 [Bacteroidales bacterium]|nr:hypothetical protein [Bacteroidales bacterium]
MKTIMNIIRKVMPRHINAQIRNFNILAFEYAQLKSIKKWEPVDKNNEPIPWYTYPCIEYLSTLDFSKKVVFEYGSGNSTIWWAKNAMYVVSVENDIKWYNKIKNDCKSLSNVKVIFANSKDEYIRSIIEENTFFDVVVIDGRWRGECAKIVGSSNVLNNNGFLIILDNSDWYRNTAKFLASNLDLIRVDFHGFVPVAAGFTSTTSVFISRNFSIDYKIPVHSINYLQQYAEDDL